MTQHPWIRDYLLLCLRLDLSLAAQGASPFVDSYYGPPELKEQAQAEGPQPLAGHLQAARRLLDRLPGQDFEPQRAAFLEKQVRALETASRIFSGEQLSLEERLRGCLDVAPQAKPEADLERALKLLDQALPGKGNLKERFQRWRELNTLPPEKAPLAVDLMQRMLAEARRRTQALVELPEGEGLEVHTIQDKGYSAANWYLGGYRSRLELNTGRPVDLSILLYQMCHEGYPGHHTEYCLKEALLYHQLGREEMCMYILSPQTVISEGIATLAFEAVFDPQEAAGWMTENVYRPLGILPNKGLPNKGLPDKGLPNKGLPDKGPAGDVDLATLYTAFSLGRADDLGNNLILLMERGFSEAQLVEYAMTYTLQPEDRVRQWLEYLRGPLAQIYNFSYYHGARLVQPLIQGEHREDAFRRVLTEQVYPSLLEAWTR